jgi:hypothetical protein
LTSGVNKPSSLPAWMDSFRSSRRLSLFIGYAIIVLMMGCLASSMVYIGRRISPNWSGEYFPWVCIAIAIEAIFSMNVTRQRSGRDKWIYVGSELVLIAVLLKILLYVLRGMDQLFADIPRWQQGFETFFEGEYFFILLPVFLLWFLSGNLASNLEVLFSDDEEYFAEAAGITGRLEKNRLEMRTSIIEMIMVIGVSIVFLTALSRVSVPEGWGIPAAVQAPVLNAVLFFVLSLILLAQTQFALLHGRWLWQRVPISPKLGWNWVKYSLIFFAILGIISIVLPTRFSRDLLAPLQYVLGWIMQVIISLMTLIMVPLGWLFSFLGGCARGSQSAPMESFQPPQLPAHQEGAPIAWIEILRYIIFWIVILAILFYAIRSYFSNNSGFLKTLRRFKLLVWLEKSLRGLMDWLLRMNHSIGDVISVGLQRLRSKRKETSAVKKRNLMNYRLLDSRRKVIFLYLALLRRSGEHGLIRKPSQTPIEYRQTLEEGVPEAVDDVEGITSSFLEARYSQKSIEDQQVNSVQLFLKRILHQLKNKKL